ncbi:MAG: aldo/keto reductase [Candidatus Nealsonbacteria bacterium]|nr:aldo/keto reductase [Candidatus Nealsonbacteria bacterium]
MDDGNHKVTRRDFHKAGSAAVASAVAGGVGRAVAAEPKPEPEKILGRHEKMGYRRLGKTDLWISEISLGGHCPSIRQDATAQENPGEVVENRKKVLAKAHELGINFIDTDMAKESRIYGQALHELKLRDQFYISFDSWATGFPEERRKDGESRKQHWLRLVDYRLRDYHTDHLDFWRPVSCMELDEMVEAFDAMHKAGKVRFLAVSNHDPEKIKQIAAHPSGKISMVLFPYFTMTKETDSGVLAACKRQDMGVVAIKPLSAGFLATNGTVKHLKKVLATPNLSAAIPGVKNVEQLEENVQASYTRDVALTERDLQELAHQSGDLFDRLPPRYQWLRKWETV